MFEYPNFRDLVQHAAKVLPHSMPVGGGLFGAALELRTRKLVPIF